MALMMKAQAPASILATFGGKDRTSQWSQYGRSCYRYKTHIFVWKLVLDSDFYTRVVLDEHGQAKNRKNMLNRGIVLVADSKNGVDPAEKRTKEFKIRVTESEYAELVARSTKPRLAEWMREYCLSASRPMPRKPAPAVDTELVNQLRRIGVNIMQITKRANAIGFDAEVRAKFLLYERHLAAIREHYTRKDTDVD